jgi:hypothetical protein
MIDYRSRRDSGYPSPREREVSFTFVRSAPNCAAQGSRDCRLDREGGGTRGGTKMPAGEPRALVAL